jgi:hypothetical protein
MMEPIVARGIARRGHTRQRNRFGELVIEHVERVAAAVPAEARATALLHDLMELTAVGADDLRMYGLTDSELVALELLTRKPGQRYEAYIRRIANARGPGGRIARAVKIADLEDHLAHTTIPPDAPPYANARRQLRRHDDPVALRAPGRGLVGEAPA